MPANADMGENESGIVLRCHSKPSDAAYWWQKALPPWVPDISPVVFATAMECMTVDYDQRFPKCCTFEWDKESVFPAALDDYLVQICLFCEKEVKPSGAVDCPCEHHRSERFKTINTVAAFVKLFHLAKGYKDFEAKCSDVAYLPLLRLHPAKLVKTFEKVLTRKVIGRLRAQMYNSIKKGHGYRKSARARRDWLTQDSVGSSRDSIKLSSSANGYSSVAGSTYSRGASSLRSIRSRQARRVCTPSEQGDPEVIEIASDIEVDDALAERMEDVEHENDRRDDDDDDDDDNHESAGDVDGDQVGDASDASGARDADDGDGGVAHRSVDHDSSGMDDDRVEVNDDYVSVRLRQSREESSDRSSQPDDEQTSATTASASRKWLPKHLPAAAPPTAWAHAELEDPERPWYAPYDDIVDNLRPN